MKNNKNFAIFALIFPILALSLHAGYREYIAGTGTRVTLPIVAYDPRDLLSGHYLTYRIDYGVTNICEDLSNNGKPAFVCLEPKEFSYTKPANCAILISGICSGNTFIAGIERYYIPQSSAQYLTEQLINGKASIELSITDGQAQVVGLKIDDKPI